MTRKGDDCSRSAVVKTAADPGMGCLCDAERATGDRLSISFFTGRYEQVSMWAYEMGSANPRFDF